MALGILLLPLRLLAAVFFATVLHELGHITVLKLQKVPIYGITFHYGGASIRAGMMTPRQERLAAAAGPAASLLLLSAARVYPELALCGLCQGLFNLLPVYPFDGGRICASFSGMSSFGMLFLKILSNLLILGFEIWGAFLFPRWIPYILGGSLGILLRMRGNIACKESVLAVQ